MSLFRTKALEAHRWFENGDHPLDGDEGEGKLVRYYRRPGVPGDQPCNLCGDVMHNHGWIDSCDETVCPGDWIVSLTPNTHHAWSDYYFTQYFVGVNNEH